MTTERDLWEERKKKAAKAGKLLTGDYVIDGSLTVLVHEEDEGITLIPETKTTYAFIRWVNRAAAFMFGLVAHEEKIVKGGHFRDNHFSMYRGTDGGKGKDGVVDIEFWDRPDGQLPMLSLQRLQVRDVETQRIIRSPKGRKFFLTVDENGILSTKPVGKNETHEDTEALGTN